MEEALQRTTVFHTDHFRPTVIYRLQQALGAILPPFRHVPEMYRVFYEMNANSILDERGFLNAMKARDTSKAFQAVVDIPDENFGRALYNPERAELIIAESLQNILAALEINEEHLGDLYFMPYVRGNSLANSIQNFCDTREKLALIGLFALSAFHAMTDVNLSREVQRVGGYEQAYSNLLSYQRLARKIISSIDEDIRDDPSFILAYAFSRIDFKAKIKKLRTKMIQTVN